MADSRLVLISDSHCTYVWFLSRKGVSGCWMLSIQAVIWKMDTLHLCTEHKGLVLWLCSLCWSSFQAMARKPDSWWSRNQKVSEYWTSHMTSRPFKITKFGYLCRQFNQYFTLKQQWVLDSKAYSIILHVQVEWQSAYLGMNKEEWRKITS